jgi:kynureninase
VTRSFTGAVDDMAYAHWLDSQDVLAPFRELFVAPETGLIYMDGNSLGQLPLRTAQRLPAVVADEWGHGLVRSWETWVRRPGEVGDLLGRQFLGASPGQVLISDSTTVNLYKLAVAALDARPGRPVVVTDDDNFPTDRYVLQGVTAQRGAELRMVPADIDQGLDLDVLAAAVDQDTALVCLSHVAYRSGALLDMAAVNQVCHAAGALVLWDLSHSVGSVPIDLDGSRADLAVGCTYKYLNAGPGAPAFLYVSRQLQGDLRQPIWGWFGQDDQFGMGDRYHPRPDITRFLVGTPPILGIAAVEEGVRALSEAGIERLRAKGSALTSYMLELADAWLGPLGFSVASPRDPNRRGSHLCLRHDQGYRVARALVEQAQVVPDYRAPDCVRFGAAPITTRFVDVFEAMRRARLLVESGAHMNTALDHRTVT